MINFEALIKVWLHDDRFNGDIWYPYTCPLTKQTTTPVRDLRTVELLSRLGRSLGLDHLPSFYFRHTIQPIDYAGGFMGWEPYTITDQMALAAKFALAYHRRNSADANFTLCVKNNHVITVRCVKTDDNVYEFWMYLHVMCPIHGKAVQHGVELHFTQGSANPFSGCTFVSMAVDI